MLVLVLQWFAAFCVVLGASRRLLRRWREGAIPHPEGADLRYIGQRFEHHLVKRASVCAANQAACLLLGSNAAATIAVLQSLGSSWYTALRDVLYSVAYMCLPTCGRHAECTCKVPLSVITVSRRVLRYSLRDRNLGNFSNMLPKPHATLRSACITLLTPLA